MLGRVNKIISYIEHCNKYGMGEKYISLDRINTMKEQANNKQKSGKRKEKEKGI